MGVARADGPRGWRSKRGLGCLGGAVSVPDDVAGHRDVLNSDVADIVVQKLF